jgi:hypothetical protein
MNTTLPLLIQFAGLLQFIIAAANFFAPAKFRYRENLAKVSPIIRQIFTVHSVYIVLVLVGFSLLCFFFPRELCGASALGKCLCGFLAFFWGLRVPIQIFYYDSAVKLANPGFAFLFGLAFLLLAAVFASATLLAL